MATAADAAESLVLPSLIAVYSDHEVPGGTVMPRQTGTGFLLAWRSRVALVTAKHVLFGHDGKDAPGRKSVFAQGGLRHLDELRWSTIGSVSEYDVAAIFLDAFPLEHCLPQFSLDTPAAPKLATVFGYLARDFKRAHTAGRLTIRPNIYTNRVRSIENGIIRFHYPQKTNLDTSSAERVVAPIPRGLSGGPLLSTNQLRQGQVQVIGVFFAWDAGVRYGVTADTLPPLLDELVDEIGEEK